MNIKIKKIVEESVIPSYARPGDACMDLTAISKKIVDEGTHGYVEYGFGLAFEIPENHVMFIFPRSSISNTGLILSNAVGVVDSGFRGEVKARFKWVPNTTQYNVGDRVAQFIVIERTPMVLEVVDELSETVRGEDGFGSTNTDSVAV